MICHHCGHDNTVQRNISRSDLCEKCAVPLRCCLNCKFYDERAYHQCREPQAEWVSDKAAANFCTYLLPQTHLEETKNSRADEARRKLDALFGGGDRS